MSAVTITLVIGLYLNGQDVEHREDVATLTECWRQARVAMAEAVVVPNDGPEVRVVRAGCFARIAPTPPT